RPPRSGWLPSTGRAKPAGGRARPRPARGPRCAATAPRPGSGWILALRSCDALSLVGVRVQPVGQRGEGRDFEVGAQVVARPGTADAVVAGAVDPARAQAGAVGAEHVHLDVVADVQHLAGRDAQALARGVEDAGV